MSMALGKAILDRVQGDLDRGDYAMARERLASYLNSKGHDPQILARMGRISFEMHDFFSAGKYWLFSSAEGEEVDAAIQEFARRCGNTPHQIVSQVPKAVRMDTFEKYPVIVRARIDDWHLQSVIQAKTKAAIARARRKNAVAGWTFTVLITLIIVFVIGCCIVGARQIMRGVFW